MSVGRRFPQTLLNLFVLEKYFFLHHSVSHIEKTLHGGSLAKHWPNVSGAKLTGTVEAEGLFGPYKKYYFYTFNNLWTKKVTFCLELIG
jgi:hypothetical protein